MLRGRLGRSARLLLVLMLMTAIRSAAAQDAAQQQPAPEKKRFEETVEVVAPAAAGAAGLAELPVRPGAVMAVAGAADNVFRTLQALPGVAATTEFDSRIAVRGGSPDENLTIMDGVEIHNPYRLFGLTSAFNPETVRGFELHAGAFSAKYGDRLSSLLVVETRPGSDASRLRGSTALSLTDANAVFEGRLPGQDKGSWLVAARRTYYDLVANSLVDTELPAFGDLQGRLDWTLRPGTRLTLFGLLSREATDAFVEDDRPGEQFTLATTARNDLVALDLRTRLGAGLSSRTTLSFYVNRDQIDADAQFRNEARRSNAPSDDVGFGLADVDFVRELEVRDLALRQELALVRGTHLVESGFELHRLRTGTAWRIEGDRNPTAGNGSSVQGGAGLPSDLDSAVDSTRAGGWLLDRWQASPRLSLEAGLRLDWSGVNQRTTLSPRLGATLRLGAATRLRAGGGLFTQSPGYEKLVQSDYFVDLSGELGRSLRHERAVHAVIGLERDLALGVSARVEAYWKDLDELIVGRLETEAERLARVAQYDFPEALASSVPASGIITSFPVNGAAGRSWGFDALVQKRPTPGARLSGWASYTWGQATRDEYGRSVPFDYDRRHAASAVASWRFSPKWELAATARAASGFPRTPVLGLRVAADETEDGRLVPALDAEGRYAYETDNGDVSNLNSASLPAFFRLDLRLSWKPRGDAGRWLFYLDVINATNRENAGQIEPRLAYDPASPLDQPRLLLEPSAAIPFLPSVGVRFRF
jgi:outer membrane receptor protein involved in Fe transport